jgi:uncharacterized protein (DUF697 family)/tellurite resistance protein
MNTSEQRALLGLCLLAAFADGNKNQTEHDRLRQITEGFNNTELNATALYQDVLLKRVTAAELAGQITSSEGRTLAYEMALGVCESDGLLGDAERTFLAELQRSLKLAEGQAAGLQEEADVITLAALPPVLAAPQPAPPAAPPTRAAEVEKTILNTAILAGALELLPNSLATMAIIPVQMRLVYRIGQQYGYALDRGHIGEFLAAVGLGMTSQVVEGYATKLMRGLLGRVAGGLGRGLSATLTGSAMSFATTWAIGQLAHRYYAGGRTLSALQLKELFQTLLGQARGLQQTYLPQMQERSRNLDLQEVAALVGKG